MIAWQTLERAAIPGGRGEISLHRRGEELSIRLGGAELMNSRQHGSEETLARLGCASIRQRARARVLVGGLGMGFTLAATLAELGQDSEVVVAELIPQVVAWNRVHLGQLAGHPLKDDRVRVNELDVRKLLREPKAFDAILLDVDNGPAGLTVDSNKLAVWRVRDSRRAACVARRGCARGLVGRRGSRVYAPPAARRARGRRTRRARARG
jgi:hypothetical protein